LNFKKQELPVIAFEYLPFFVICVFGVFSNALNIAVFLNSRLKDKSFKYMMASSLADLLYLGLASFDFIEYCDLCPILKTYSTQFYNIIVDSYLTSCLAIFSILVELFLSVERLLILSNKPYCQKISYIKSLFILAVISFVYYTPVLFLYKITPITNISNDTQELDFIPYKLESSDFGTTKIGMLTPAILHSIRIVIAVGFVSIINIFTAILFKKRFEKRLKNKKKLEKSKKNFFNIFFNLSIT
jgi:hypothetical protein